MKIKNKIKLLGSILLIALFFYSCLKKDIQKNADDLVFVGKQTITLEEAFDLIGQKTGVKIKSNVNVQGTSVNAFNTPITCPSYPVVRTSTSLSDITVNSSSSETAPLTGAGVAIPYKFSQGSTYVIEIMIGNVAYGTAGKTHPSQDKNPSLQMGLANTQNFPAQCNGSVNLALLGIPYANMGKLPIQKYPYTSSDFTTTYTTKTVTLTATECFNYLWVNFMPPDGAYRNNHHISYIKITRSGQNFSIEGPSDITTNSVYKVKSNSFLLDHPFIWRTTGNIAIVGDSIGPSLTVQKSNTSPLKGTISAILPGCGEIAIKKFDVCETLNSFVDINGPSIIKVGQSNRSYSWTLTDSKYANLSWSLSTSELTTSSPSSNSLLISVPRTYKVKDQTAQGDYVTLTITGTGPCGVSSVHFPIFVSTGYPPINPQQ
ncbi:hypothetical protein [Sphingobacterium siyangense]